MTPEKTRMPSLTAAEITEGQALPRLTHKVSATTVVLGALASRDWRPMHHDKEFATHRNGVQDIFLNTPNNAAWLERYITDWSGPLGRLGRLRFQMKKPVFPGDEMVFSGSVLRVSADDSGCHWVDLQLSVSVNDEQRTEGQARIAVPSAAGDNPWKRKGAQWKP